MLLSSCVVSTLADCGVLQRFKVKHQWNEAYGSGHHRLDFGLKLWNSIFHDNPQLRQLFKRVNGDNTYSAEFEAHSQRVLGGLNLVISTLDDQATLNAQLAHLKAQHTDRNVQPAFYEAFRDELLSVLPEYLGTKLDFAAWNDCINLVISSIQ